MRQRGGWFSAILAAIVVGGIVFLLSGQAPGSGSVRRLRSAQIGGLGLIVVGIVFLIASEIKKNRTKDNVDAGGNALRLCSLAATAAGALIVFLAA